MAQKRMFSKKITDSDKFLDLPLTAQALYFHLNMHADDDGFIDRTKTIKRMIGASDGDLKILFEQAFVIPFESGVVVIKDWKIHNYIPKDRYQQTVYTAEFSRLALAENSSYTDCIQNVYNMDTQIRLDKIREDKIREDKNRLDKQSAEEKDSSPAPENNLKIVSDYYQKEIGILSPNQFEQLSDYIIQDKMEVAVVLKAISEAADNGKRNFKYISAILRNWKQDGIMTLAQVEDRERQRIEQKAKSRGKVQSAKDNIPEWSNPDYKDETTEEDMEELKKIQQEIAEKLNRGSEG